MNRVEEQEEEVRAKRWKKPGWSIAAMNEKWGEVAKETCVKVHFSIDFASGTTFGLDIIASWTYVVIIISAEGKKFLFFVRSRRRSPRPASISR